MGSSREDFSQCWSELVSAAGTLLAKQGQTRAVGAFLGRKDFPTGLCRIKRKEAVPVVSHIGAKETPSAGSDPLGCASLFHLMSPAIFPGGQGPHQGSGAGGCGTYTGPFPI